MYSEIEVSLPNVERLRRLWLDECQGLPVQRLDALCLLAIFILKKAQAVAGFS